MSNILQEDKGLIAIHHACVQMQAIWRKTNEHDLGIDGQVEFLEPGTSISTGIIIAVQSKSGPSYFENQDNNYVKFYPEGKHRKYWAKLKIPVFLVLHNPLDNMTIFTAVKPQLSGNNPILVNKKKLFDATARDILLSSADENQITPTPSEILNRFKNIEVPRGENQILTGIDFLLACTNRERRYFEIRMVRVKALFDILSAHHGFGIGQADYDYILRNVITILSKKLAEDFLDEFEDMWYGLNTVPDIISPFTSTGDDVIDYLWSNLETYLSINSYTHLNIKSPKKLAKFISEYAQSLSDKLDASDRMPIEPR